MCHVLITEGVCMNVAHMCVRTHTSSIYIRTWLLPEIKHSVWCAAPDVPKCAPDSTIIKADTGKHRACAHPDSAPEVGSARIAV